MDRECSERSNRFSDPKPETFICVKHFVDGKPTAENPHPTLFMTKPSNEHGSTPTKRKKLLRGQLQLQVPCTPKRTFLIQISNTYLKVLNKSLKLHIQILHLKMFREKGWSVFYTGLQDPSTFKLLHDFLRPKSKNMNYWKGEAQNSNAARSLTALFDTFKKSGAETPPVK